MLPRFIRRVFGGWVRRYKWDREYASGKWEYLWEDQLEEDRFNAVADLANRYCRRGKIIEIGCGTGLLQAKIAVGAYAKYVGMDISRVAIARTRPSEKVSFICADMETFIPPERFDLIIFNESLYYSKYPLALLARYTSFLTPEGLLLIALFDKFDGNDRLMAKIKEKFQCLEELAPTNEKGTWYCQVYRP
jgi:SAM-dependent methyltransferase